jgi:hypothetical protein
MELYFHSTNTPSWFGAQLKHRDKFTFALPLPLPAYYEAVTKQEWKIIKHDN